GGTQQHNVALPRVDAALQIVDRGRLVPRRRILADDLEPATRAHHRLDRAVLGARPYGVSGSESDVHRVEPHTDIGCSRAYAWVFTLPSTRNSTWSHAPTPIPKGSCARWKSTP